MKTFTFTAVWEKRPRQHQAYFKRGVVSAENPDEAIALLKAHPLIRGAERIGIIPVRSNSVEIIVG